MKTSPVTKGVWRVASDRRRCGDHASVAGGRADGAFTLIEIMVVVGILGIILSMGIPSIYRAFKKEGMRKATSDVEDVCRLARAQAIFSGEPRDVVFHPLDRRLEVGGGGGGSRTAGGGGEGVPERPSVSPTSSSAEIDEDITIEMLDINLSEYKDSEWARVRFYPNGTSDEMTLVLRSSRNEWKKITLEVTTGFTSVDSVR